MRKKELKLVVTFHTTADAMAMEKVCKERGTPGGSFRCQERFLQAAAWPGAPLEDREKIAAVMKETGIEEEAMHECMV